MTSEHCNMPIKGFKMYLLKHTEAQKGLESTHQKNFSPAFLGKCEQQSALYHHLPNQKPKVTLG